MKFLSFLWGKINWIIMSIFVSIGILMLIVDCADPIAPTSVGAGDIDTVIIIDSVKVIPQVQVQIIVEYASTAPEGYPTLCSIYEDNKLVYLFMKQSIDTITVRDSALLHATYYKKYVPGVATADTIATQNLLWRL